ncbi:rRNA small subunit 7-methylguanosine (m7G) methyltransferase GidB [Vulgatibacter incomptus]|uniref:Ribosomal RNA small subunit methyltransferase G n=1 Tax=Vulgatibacter incomptus TaxID=1391653 RepID=A0A0K1PH63_9BACT|nr:rRNA small subunit 7-methylguanosine (m7G) methyltransferase GidB [Vulgatibacter incomptus]
MRSPSPREPANGHVSARHLESDAELVDVTPSRQHCWSRRRERTLEGLRAARRKRAYSTDDSNGGSEGDCCDGVARGVGEEHMPGRCRPVPGRTTAQPAGRDPPGTNAPGFPWNSTPSCGKHLLTATDAAFSPNCGRSVVSSVRCRFANETRGLEIRPVEEPVEIALKAVVDEARRSFGVEVGPEALDKLAAFVTELLKWNRKINLTAIEDPAAVAELHVLDSLAIGRHVPDGAKLLDVGTGGGFPGIPLAIVRPDVECLLVDRTEKKVLFLKTVIARLGLRNARAAHLRIEGDPASEGIAPSDVVVSRAFAAPGEWLALAKPYVRPGGLAIAMLGSEEPAISELEADLGVSPGAIAMERYRLPSGARRALLLMREG